MTLQMNYQEKYEQGVEHGMEQGRILSVAEFLSNGGDENLAKKLLKATDDELRQAKELLVNP